jgi:hypothetical protein
MGMCLPCCGLLIGLKPGLAMPAHEKAIKRLQRRVAAAKNREEQDAALDQILDVTQRATEWDADQWGFDPDRWMEAERVEINRRDS